ncbi:MAG TPA: hypothetical protein VEV45_20875 [Streptosporangiaceae bacterium]|nr:hypothetical protein [Streptosporangiaceae bacterium]
MATDAQITAARDAAGDVGNLLDHEQWGKVIDAASASTERGLMILETRLAMLADEIRARDWEQVEFQYDRVLSITNRTAGHRDRPYDPDASAPTSPTVEFARPDAAPPTVENHDHTRILHRYLMQGVIYSTDAKTARQRIAASALYLDAAALVADLP